MKKQLILIVLAIALFGGANSYGQVIIYSEDFDGALTWTLNTDPTGEDSNPNHWYISCEEEGVGAGACGTACGAGDQTLHVGPNPLAGDLGAEYAETGMALTGTNRRAESADISTVGHEDLTLEFDMIGMGGGDDFCELFYSIDGGVSWTPIATPLVELCCGGITCTGDEQGLWAARTFSLPAECEGVANLRISFVWQNVDDGVSTNPSFAVDNIKISKPVVVVDGGPTALFSPEDITICQGESVTYTDMSSTDDVITDWNWVFDGGMPASSLTEGPHVVLYPAAGVFTTTLTVTDGIGSHDTSFTVTVVDGPYAGESAEVELCEGETLDLNTLIPGADADGDWVETTGSPSGTFTEETGVLDAAGLPIGNVYTFDYETLAGADPCPGTDIATITVTIIECADLFASFGLSSTTICAGDCMTFTDESTGPITGYVWTFSDPGISGPITDADPGEICFENVGDWEVTLTVTDGTDFDDTTVTITVNPLPVVTATADATTICIGDEVTLTGDGDAIEYTWSDGVTDGETTTLEETRTFTVTGLNNFGCANTDEITINVIDCEPLAAGFLYEDIICVGDCITFTDTSAGDPVAWRWDWGGAVSPWLSTDQNPTVCFTVPGIFDIQLTVTNELGEMASTTQSVTVFQSSAVEAELDTIIDIGGAANLIAAGSLPEGTYFWEPDQNIECADCPVTTASPEADTQYIVTFTDVNGCSNKDTVRVFVNFVEAIGVADAFSPNGDGNNDVLYVNGYGLEAIVFSIYNKYGEKVFESRTQDIGWDGSFKGRPENPGVFTWVLEYQFINGRSGVLKGNTTIIR